MKQASFQDLISAPLEPPKIDESTFFHVGVSGGKDSAAALLWMRYESGIAPERILATWCDIGNDHEWTREHVSLLSRTVHPVETIYPEFDFFTLARIRRRFPSACARFCTEELKIIPTAQHLLKLKLSGKKIISVSGVRADESEDRSKLDEWDFSGNLLCYQWRPLIRWTLADVLAIHERQNVPMNPLYALGAKRVGCWPCIMSNKEEIRTIALRFPERIDEIRAAERGFLSEFGRYSSFFASDVVPPRFRSMPFTCKDGREVNVATIDDVVRWSMTGKRARGHYTDEAPKPISCNSGYCE